jgi:hypothetical protein
VGGDGLLGIYFTTGSRYSSIQVLNNGGLLIIYSGTNVVPVVERFRVAELPEIISRINAHIS